ncbi:MAG: ferritin-like domain-containing protein [Acidobacteriaceae bacterium]
MKTLDSLVEKALSRRSFLASAGAVAATAAIAGCSNNGTTTPVTTTPVTTSPVTTAAAAYTDADVLNFALNLEYLEAQFYLYAATGAGLSGTDTVAPSGYKGTFSEGTVTVGDAAQVAGLSSAQQEILNEIAFEEQTHVQFLRSALGSAAVPMPSIDLSFFGPLAVAANITTNATGTGSFNPFSSFDYFLVGAFIFEDVGVTAYSGAAPLISAAGVASGLLTAAAGILAVEAYHAGYVRTSLTGRAIAAGSASAYPYLNAANLVEALRATLTVGNSAAPSTSGSVETLLTLPTSSSTPSAIVAASPSDAVGFSRTVNQVHHIVYGSPAVGVKSGGFFPNGTNSIFATTTA